VDHLGREGVTCTVCHQIQDTDDVAATFTGGFTLDHDRRIFGPFDDPFANPMINQSGFTPTGSPHVRDSQLCASCHTVITRALDESGIPSGPPFAEQAPYLEWSNSSYRTDTPAGATPTSCQSCHMAATDPDTGEPLQTVLSVRPPGRLGVRSPVRAHTFVGANRHMLEILRAQQTWAGLNVDDSVLERAINATRAFLAESATVKPLDQGDIARGIDPLQRDLAEGDEVGVCVPDVQRADAASGFFVGGDGLIFLDGGVFLVLVEPAAAEFALEVGLAFDFLTVIGIGQVLELLRAEDEGLLLQGLHVTATRERDPELLASALGVLDRDLVAIPRRGKADDLGVFRPFAAFPGQRDGGALARAALEGEDAAVILLDHLPGDRQAKAHAADLAGAEQVDAVSHGVATHPAAIVSNHHVSWLDISVNNISAM
jgi:hypothetical protein